MDTINIAGLNILLEQTPAGPILSTKDRWLESLAWVVNSAAAGGSAAGLADALERGDDLSVQGLYAMRPEPDDPFVEEAKARWREWTGNDAGDDVYIVGTTFTEHQIVIPRLALIEILTKLKELQQQTPLAPVPWLFCPDPINPDPGKGEEEIMRDLERRAVELDTLEKEKAETDAPSVELVATISAKRRFLLLELNAAGLFHEAHASNKRFWLITWELHTLLGYFEAALKLLAYFSSVDRRRYIPDAGLEPVPGARVSVDWYRIPGDSPEGFRPEQWLGYCESILMTATSTEGGEGDIFVHQGKLRFQLYWRKDDGITPALVSATLL
jgi:hypothetical protein